MNNQKGSISIFVLILANGILLFSLASLSAYSYFIAYCRQAVQQHNNEQLLLAFFDWTKDYAKNNYQDLLKQKAKKELMCAHNVDQWHLIINPVKDALEIQVSKELKNNTGQSIICIMTYKDKICHIHSFKRI